MSHEDFEKELQALRENLPTVVEEATGSKSVAKINYSIDLANRICDYAIQGISLHEISFKGEMPDYPTLLRWSKNHPEFSKMLRSVREARAIHFEEAAIRTAENCNDKDEVGIARLKVETYWRAAEVNDASVYGKKIQTQHEVSGKVAIQVVTGFGPPNEWQTPPKLKSDGTIDKEASQIKDVKSEVLSESKTEPRSNSEKTSISGQSQEPDPAGTLERPTGHANASSVRRSHYEFGVEALPALEGYSDTHGSPESP